MEGSWTLWSSLGNLSAEGEWEEEWVTSQVARSTESRLSDSTGVRERVSLMLDSVSGLETAEEDMRRDEWRSCFWWTSW
jgi:hypothetical protein